MQCDYPVEGSSEKNYPHPDNHTTTTSDTPAFKPFTMLLCH